MSDDNDTKVNIITLPGNMYNMLHGINELSDMLAVMLELDCGSNAGNGKYKVNRYRDLYLNDTGNIILFTRGGGNNREDYDSEEVYDHPNYIRSWDQEFDSTYAYYEFTVPEKHKDFINECMAAGMVSEDPQDKFFKFMEKLKGM